MELWPWFPNSGWYFQDKVERIRILQPRKKGRERERESISCGTADPHIIHVLMDTSKIWMSWGSSSIRPRRNRGLFSFLVLCWSCHSPRILGSNRRLHSALTSPTECISFASFTSSVLSPHRHFCNSAAEPSSRYEERSRRPHGARPGFPQDILHSASICSVYPMCAGGKAAGVWT
jgi:hypothetical protein